jgi:citrate lyase beta subunit
LYVPGNDLNKLTKAASLGVDGVILDLEDGVANNRKDEARGVILEALRNLDFGRSEKLVRINALSTGRAREDLRAVLPGRPEAVVVPKVDSPEILVEIEREIRAIETENQFPVGEILILALIESGQAFVNLAAICRSSQRLTGLILGAEDLAANVGMTRTPMGQEMLYARSAMVMHAAAFGLQAIDMVQTDFKNLELLQSESSQAAGLGFSGKQIIHPAQVDTVQQCFTPSPAAVEKALKVIAGAQTAQESGKGAYNLDGEMVDMPVVKKAESILAQARAAGMLD